MNQTFIKPETPCLTREHGMQFAKVIAQHLSSGQKVVLDLSEKRVASPAFFVGCFAEMPIEQIRSLRIGRLEDMTKAIMHRVLKEIFDGTGQFQSDFYQIVVANGQQHPLLHQDRILRVYTSNGYAEWSSSTLFAQDVDPDIYDQLIASNYQNKLQRERESESRSKGALRCVRCGKGFTTLIGQRKHQCQAS